MAATNTLTDTAIRKAAPSDKPRKLANGRGRCSFLSFNVVPSKDERLFEGLRAAA